MKKKLTAKQENFCLKYVECGNQSEAYRYAYSTKNMTNKTVNEESSRLIANPNVSARVEELQNEVKEEFSISFEQKLKWLQEVVIKNLAEDKPSAAVVSAINEINKMVGDHAAIKTESKHSIENLSEDELDATAKELAKQIGLIDTVHQSTH